INRADGVLIKDGGVAIGLADDQVGGNLHPVVQYLVLDFFPGTEPRQHRRNIQRPLDREIRDRYQTIALMYPSLFTWALRSDKYRHHRRILADSLALIEPSDAVVRQVKFVLLLKVDGSRNDGRHGDDHQQCTDELLPQ